jgi:hypothetical protein
MKHYRLYQRTDSAAVAETLPDVEHALRVATCWDHPFDSQWDNNFINHTVKKEKYHPMLGHVRQMIVSSSTVVT